MINEITLSDNALPGNTTKRRPVRDCTETAP